MPDLGCRPEAPRGTATILTSGTTPHVTLACESIFERTASRDGQRPALTIRDKVSIDIRYTGDGRVMLPSGNWEVKKLAFKMTRRTPRASAAKARACSRRSSG